MQRSPSRHDDGILAGVRAEKCGATCGCARKRRDPHGWHFVATISGRRVYSQTLFVDADAAMEGARVAVRALRGVGTLAYRRTR